MKTHNILIIVDSQNDFITGSLANKEAQEKDVVLLHKIGVVSMFVKTD